MINSGVSWLKGRNHEGVASIAHNDVIEVKMDVRGTRTCTIMGLDARGCMWRENVGQKVGRLVGKTRPSRIIAKRF